MSDLHPIDAVAAFLVLGAIAGWVARGIFAGRRAASPAPCTRPMDATAAAKHAGGGLPHDWRIERQWTVDGASRWDSPVRVWSCPCGARSMTHGIGDFPWARYGGPTSGRPMPPPSPAVDQRLLEAKIEAQLTIWGKADA